MNDGALDRLLDQAVGRLARRVLALEKAMLDRPELRQGKVTVVNTGPPKTVDVLIGETTVTQVTMLDWYATAVPAVNDGVWVLSLPSGRRVCLGDLD